MFNNFLGEVRCRRCLDHPLGSTSLKALLGQGLKLCLLHQVSSYPDIENLELVRIPSTQIPKVSATLFANHPQCVQKRTKELFPLPIFHSVPFNKKNPSEKMESPRKYSKTCIRATFFCRLHDWHRAQHRTWTQPGDQDLS